MVESYTSWENNHSFGSYLKFGIGPGNQVVTRSSGGIPFPGVTICRRGNPVGIMEEWLI